MNLCLGGVGTQDFVSLRHDFVSLRHDFVSLFSIKKIFPE